MTNKNMLSVFTAGVLAMGLVSSFVYSPVFAEGPVDIEIVEVVEDGSGGFKPWEDIVGTMPGASYSAIPRVRNVGEVPAMVRMCLTQSATDTSGGAVVLPTRAFEIEINQNWALESITPNSDDPASGNCYNYNSVLEVGAVTEPIFSEVVLSGELGNEFKNCTFNLYLTADATENNQPASMPSNPDTGVATNSEPLTTTNAVFLSIGLAVLIGMVIYLIRNSFRKE